RDKKAMQFMTNRTQLVFKTMGQDIDSEIVVGIGPWGYTNIRVSSTADFLTLEKEVLTEKDFVENHSVLRFHIDGKKVAECNRHAVIVFENIYQKIEVKVKVVGESGAYGKQKKRQLQECYARFHRAQIAFMMDPRKSVELVKVLSEYSDIFERDEKNKMLYRGYLGYLMGDQAYKDEFLDYIIGMSAPDSYEDNEKIMRYVLTQYVKYLIDGDPETKRNLIEKLGEYYSANCRNIMTFILLDRLGGISEFPINIRTELEYFAEKNVRNPYVSLYHMTLLINNTDALTELNPHNITTLFFGLKYGIMTRELSLKIAFLIAKNKKLNPSLLALLSGCYRAFPSEDLLHGICALLIRTESTDKKFFPWFNLGVSNRLRITELFEYYMYTMDSKMLDAALPTVVTYFKYENHLRSSVKASFFASIVRNKNKHPEYYEIYRDMIRDFVISQIKKRVIDQNMAVLYDEFISEKDVNVDIAEDLVEILFDYNIRVDNPNIDRVLVVQDETAVKKVYNLKKSEANIALPTSHYNLYFLDRDGRYHGRTITYHLDKYLMVKTLAKKCYELGVNNEKLLTHVFSEALKKDQINAVDAAAIHSVIKSDKYGIEYGTKALLKLYDFYKSTGDDAALAEVISRMDFKYLPSSRRSGVLQTLIQFKEYDRAISELKKYDIKSGTKKILLLLVSSKIEENPHQFDPFYMQLADELFVSGIVNEISLRYLCEFYMGYTHHLLEIYRRTIKRGVDITDGAIERLLGQALFVNADLTEYKDVFLEYHEYGANRTLVKAVLNSYAYFYITRDVKIDEKIVSILYAESLKHTNELHSLAVLKYLSCQKEYSDLEREYAEYQISNFSNANEVFPFMKEFIGKLQVPNEVEQCATVVYFSSRRGDPQIRIIDKDRSEVKSMKRVVADIYVFNCPVFVGDDMDYEIIEKNTLTVLDKGHLSSGVSVSAIGDRIDSFYDIINFMSKAVNEGNSSDFQRYAAEYQKKQHIADSLFGPI
ncbi:MAG: DUF5717 family protein, partial [Eubacterium sp.]|nr:DUF5717 family protein [Eubacterium sp.]